MWPPEMSSGTYDQSVWRNVARNGDDYMTTTGGIILVNLRLVDEDSAYHARSRIYIRNAEVDGQFNWDAVPWGPITPRNETLSYRQVQTINSWCMHPPGTLTHTIYRVWSIS